MADNTGTGGKGEVPGWVVASSLRTHRSGLPFLGQLLPGQARTCGVRVLDEDVGGHLSPTILEGARTKTCPCQAPRRKRRLEPLVDQSGHPSHPCLVSCQTDTLCASGDRPPGQMRSAGGRCLLLAKQFFQLYLSLKTQRISSVSALSNSRLTTLFSPTPFYELTDNTPSF